MPGFEVRYGALDAVCDLRVEEGTSSLPSVGWNTGATHLTTTLNLPPGWTLVHAFGVDRASNSWIDHWTLYDLFLVLVLSFATSHLFRRRAGVIMCATLALTYHESGAPLWLWVSTLVAIALFRALPDGKLKKLTGLWKWTSLGLLIFVAFFFSVRNIKNAIYPHLNYYDSGTGRYDQYAPSVPPESKMAMVEEEVAQMADRFEYRSQEPMKQVNIDPNAVVQTGPGIPDWNWNSIYMTWNGPVGADEGHRLVLISPFWNAVLAFLRCALVLVMIAILLGLKRIPIPKKATAMLIPCLIFLITPAVQAQIPDEALLEQLKAHLLKPDPCLPSCASLNRAQISLREQRFSWQLEYHASSDVAVPLPGPDGLWLVQAISIDGKDIKGALKQEGWIWIPLTEGVHDVTVSGILAARDSASLSFRLTPRQLDLNTNDWSSEHDDREANQILLTRTVQQSEREQDKRYDQQTFPSHWLVIRRFVLGLDWNIETTVLRLSQGKEGSALSIPLLPGETVTTPNTRVKDNAVRVNMSPNDRQITWRSALEPAQEIQLKSDGTEFLEQWQLDASAIWHVETHGIPPMHFIHPSGQWQPEWSPWPGESVVLNISRPKAVDGDTATISETSLHLTPGRRSTQMNLCFTINTSRGDRMTIALPEESEAPSLTLNGESKPYTLNGQELALQLAPGTTVVDLDWRLAEGITTAYRVPKIVLGDRAVNNRIEVEMPQRWTLYAWGSDMGPAVLFWPFLLVLAFFSWILGGLDFTPLKHYQWFLLGLGVSQISPISIFFIFTWLLAIGAKQKLYTRLHPALYNLCQIFLALVTFVALLMLLDAVRRGLLGSPNMQIAGNGSDGSNLRFYTEQCAQVLAQPMIISISIWFYKLAMLAWSLWMAKSLIVWLKWAWTQFQDGGLFRPWARKVATHPPTGG